MFFCPPFRQLTQVPPCTATSWTTREYFVFTLILIIKKPGFESEYLLNCRYGKVLTGFLEQQCPKELSEILEYSTSELFNMYGNICLLSMQNVTSET